MTDLEILQRARKLISDPAHWTQGEYARDAEGYKVPANSKHATCWCALGAMQKASHRRDLPYSLRALINMHSISKSIHAMNDMLPHAEVLKVFDEAIASASGAAIGAA